MLLFHLNASQSCLILVQSSGVHNFSDFRSHGILDHAATDFIINSDFDGTPLGAW